MCSSSRLADQSTFLRTKCVPTNQEDANQLFEQMINGYLLHVIHPESFEEKVMVTISTICALCKEFEMDWIADGLVTASVEEQKAAIKKLGFYQELPVKTLFMLLRRMVKLGFKKPSLGLMALLAKFHKQYNQPEQAWWVLCSYLYTAFKAVRMTKPDFATPFEIHIESRGVTTLRYYYRSKKSGRQHFLSSMILCRFPNKVRTQQIAKLFSEPKNLV